MKKSIGRNSPCPCGSGLKYKKCCLSNPPQFDRTPYNCRGQKRYIESSIRKLIRQQSGFGCAYCGCPIIEYHHIIPFHEVKSNNPENLIALCPTCHKRADEGGSWSKEFVQQIKFNPHNRDVVKDKFAIYSSDFLIKCGMIEFQGCGELVRLQNQIVLGIDKNPEGIILVNSYFFDSSGRLIAFIVENEWGIYIDRVWDVEFISARNLKVRSSPRNIILEMEITDQLLNIKNCFFQYKGSIFQSKTTTSGRTILDIRDSSGKTRIQDENKKIIFSKGAGINVM